MRTRIAAIINPVSGRRAMMPTVQRIGGETRRAGGTLDIFTSERFGHAIVLASNLHVDVEAVLVVGGDGTVREVVNGLAEDPVPLAIVRTGTENLLARELRMPTEPPRLVQTLLYRESVPLDAGVINGRRFLAVAGAGFDADCVLRMSAKRKGHIIHGNYFWPIWRTFWAHRFPTLRIDVDDQRVSNGAGFAILGVIGGYSMGLRVLKRSVRRWLAGLVHLPLSDPSQPARAYGAAIHKTAPRRQSHDLPSVQKDNYHFLLDRSDSGRWRCVGLSSSGVFHPPSCGTHSSRNTRARLGIVIVRYASGS